MLPRTWERSVVHSNTCELDTRTYALICHVFLWSCNSAYNISKTYICMYDCMCSWWIELQLQYTTIQIQSASQLNAKGLLIANLQAGYITRWSHGAKVGQKDQARRPKQMWNTCTSTKLKFGKILVSPTCRLGFHITNDKKITFHISRCILRRRARLRIPSRACVVSCGRFWELRLW